MNDFYSSKQMMSNISTSAFTSVGKSLKNRRIRDYKENFGNHLTDQLGYVDRGKCSENLKM